MQLSRQSAAALLWCFFKGACSSSAANVGAAGAECIAGNCSSLVTDDTFLLQRVVDISDSGMDEEDDSMTQAESKPSCLDESVAFRTIEPIEIDQNANPFNVVLDCRSKVGWEISAEVLAMIEKARQDPDDFKFKVCWNVATDPTLRWFPWMHATGEDWKMHLAHEGSVLLKPQAVKSAWDKGYQNLMPDALEYFSRRGEVVGRKLIPRWMLFGWSKGATFNFPLSRWRPDIIQGSVLAHGCNQPSRYANSAVKAQPDGAAPTLWFSSKLDGYLKCTFRDSTKQCAKAEKNARLQEYVETPCSHHPERCWPVCDYRETYYTPFWDFVRRAYSNMPCREWTSKDVCENQLCKWDDELSLCDAKYPGELTQSCSSFCDKSQVDDCAGLSEAACASSYVLHPLQVANANGMHSRCSMVDGQCVTSTAQFQCLFQADCPGIEQA